MSRIVSGSIAGTGEGRADGRHKALPGEMPAVLPREQRARAASSGHHVGEYCRDWAEWAGSHTDVYRYPLAEGVSL